MIKGKREESKELEREKERKKYVGMESKGSWKKRERERKILRWKQIERESRQ